MSESVEWNLFTHLYLWRASPITSRLSRVCRCTCSTRWLRGARARKAWTRSCTRWHCSASDFVSSTPGMCIGVDWLWLAADVWADASSPARITLLACGVVVLRCRGGGGVGGLLVCTAAIARHRLGMMGRRQRIRREDDSIGKVLSL